MYWAHFISLNRGKNATEHNKQNIEFSAFHNIQSNIIHSAICEDWPFHFCVSFHSSSMEFVCLFSICKHILYHWSSSFVPKLYFLLLSSFRLTGHCLQIFNCICWSFFMRITKTAYLCIGKWRRKSNVTHATTGKRREKKMQSTNSEEKPRSFKFIVL